MALFLRIIREASAYETTLSALYIDDHWFCWCLEDVIREPRGWSRMMPLDWKVPKRTAIPAGTYPLVLTPSARFDMITPEILNVPGFTATRIHPGNVHEDTEGCLIVGDVRMRRQPNDHYDAKVANSRHTFARLMNAIGRDGGDRHVLLIENPLTPPSMPGLPPAGPPPTTSA